MSDALPLTRLLKLDELGAKPKHVHVETTLEERTALARHLAIPAVHALSARYVVQGSPKRLLVNGDLTAKVSQVCVVTLEPFDVEIAEKVDNVFSVKADEADPDDLDAPDPIENEQIDLGLLTMEFLALALDPYPRKPDASFADIAPDAAPESPFAALSAFKTVRNPRD